MIKKWVFIGKDDKCLLEFEVHGIRDNSSVAIRLQDRWGRDCGPLIVETEKRTYYVDMTNVAYAYSENIED